MYYQVIFVNVHQALTFDHCWVVTLVSM